MAYQPQYFKFSSLNPLNVRTKIRALQRVTLLEACVENCTSRPLLLAGVRFDAALGVAALPVTAEAAGSPPASPPAEEGTRGAAPISYTDTVQVCAEGHALLLCSPLDCTGAASASTRQLMLATHQNEEPVVQVINANGSSTFLYLLTGKPGSSTGPVGGALGKLDIR